VLLALAPSAELLRARSFPYTTVLSLDLTLDLIGCHLLNRSDGCPALRGLTRRQSSPNLLNIKIRDHVWSLRGAIVLLLVSLDNVPDR
jgi:hypothetical protein